MVIEFNSFCNDVANKGYILLMGDYHSAGFCIVHLYAYNGDVAFHQKLCFSPKVLKRYRIKLSEFNFTKTLNPANFKDIFLKFSQLNKLGVKRNFRKRLNKFNRFNK